MLFFCVYRRIPPGVENVFAEQHAEKSSRGKKRTARAEDAVDATRFRSPGVKDTDHKYSSRVSSQPQRIDRA